MMATKKQSKPKTEQVTIQEMETEIKSEELTITASEVKDPLSEKLSDIDRGLSGCCSVWR